MGNQTTFWVKTHAEHCLHDEPGVTICDCGGRFHKATRDELVAALSQIDGAEEIEVTTKDGSYGFVPIVVQSQWLFIDMDHDIATDLAPGRYLVIPVGEEPNHE